MVNLGSTLWIWFESIIINSFWLWRETNNWFEQILLPVRWIGGNHFWKASRISSEEGCHILSDNIKLQVPLVTKQKYFGWEIATHLPYSPDTALSDYNLFWLYSLFCFFCFFLWIILRKISRDMWSSSCQWYCQFV